MLAQRKQNNVSFSKLKIEKKIRGKLLKPADFHIDVTEKQNRLMWKTQRVLSPRFLEQQGGSLQNVCCKEMMRAEQVGDELNSET